MNFPFHLFALRHSPPPSAGDALCDPGNRDSFNAFLGGWEKETMLFGRKLSLNILNISLAVITLGGIAF